MRLGNNVLLGFILNVLLISIGGVELVVITRSVRSWVIAGYLISSDRGSPGRGPGNSWRHSNSVCLWVVHHQDEADQFFTRITLCQHFIKSICFVIHANLPQVWWHHHDLPVTNLHSSSWIPRSQLPISGAFTGFSRTSISPEYGSCNASETLAFVHIFHRSLSR